MSKTLFSAKDDTFIDKNKVIRKISYGAILLALLALLVNYNFLLFHSIVEFFSIFVAVGIFIVMWNAKEVMKNNFFMFLGITYFYVGLFHLVHTISYEGMGVFPEYGANLPTELWIAARMVEIVGLLVAPLLIKKSINPKTLFAWVTGGAAALFVVIFTGYFPDCYIEGVGLTLFKKLMEYIFIILLIVVGVFIYREKESLDKGVLSLLLWFLIFTALAEIAFTFYVSVYGLSNIIGHFSKLIAFYLIYEAIVVTSISHPQDILFRDLKSSKESLERTTAMLQEAEEIADIGTWEWNIQEERLSFSDSWLRIHGCSKKNMSQEQMMNLLHPEDREKVEGAMNIAFTQGNSKVTHRIRKSDTGEVRYIQKHIRVRFASDTGKPLCMIGTVQDVTERKQTEEELKTIRDLLDATQKIAKVGGWEWDVKRQTMTWSDQTYLIHGFEPGEFAAGSPEHIQRSLACYDPDDRPKIDEAFRKCVEEGEAYTLELPLTTSQGRRIWVHTSGQPVWEDGKVVKVQGHIMDITERKELEELKEHISRMTWHDIRSPLNGILGVPQVLLDDSNLTDTQREFLQMIIDSGRSVLNMVNLSLTIYQIEQGTYEPTQEYFDVLKLIRQCKTENEAIWKSKDIEIIISTNGFESEDPDPITVAGEEFLAYSVVSNLLQNAFEAAPEREVVQIDITNAESYILFSVHNQGEVPENIRDTFFDKYTTSGKKKGTGLGTYSAKILAEAQGWGISMETSEDEGTTITLTIPK